MIGASHMHCKDAHTIMYPEIPTNIQVIFYLKLPDLDENLYGAIIFIRFSTLRFYEQLFTAF